MTSVDSGVETSNESNDSCVAHDQRSLEISPIKISHSCEYVNSLTNVNVIMANLCTVNTAPSSSTSGIIDCNKEKRLRLLPEKKKPILELEPPAGLSFSELKVACGFGEGYEIIENDRDNRDHVARRRRARLEARARRLRKLHDPWLSFKDERKLRYAASTNNEEHVTDLLESGVNPNCYDHLLRTPLHLAACRGYSNVVRLLLEKGANPNQRDALDNTPLHLAACTNHVEVVTLLLKAGTDVNSSDYYGRNPLQLAQSKLKLLQRGSNNEDSLKIKEEVQKVIEMMFTFLHKKGQDSEAELLNAFQTRLTISQTKEEVETDVRDLLASLNDLNLNKSDS